MNTPPGVWRTSRVSPAAEATGKPARTAAAPTLATASEAARRQLAAPTERRRPPLMGTPPEARALGDCCLSGRSVTAPAKSVRLTGRAARASRGPPDPRSLGHTVDRKLGPRHQERMCRLSSHWARPALACRRAPPGAAGRHPSSPPDALGKRSLPARAPPRQSDGDAGSPSTARSCPRAVTRHPRYPSSTQTRERLTQPRRFRVKVLTGRPDEHDALGGTRTP